MQHSSAAATVDNQHCADTIRDAVSVIDHCWPGMSGTQFPPWMKCALRIVRLYSSHGDPAKRVPFEDGMRKESWRAADARLKKNEVAIQAGRREHWPLLMIQRQVEVDEILQAIS
jgi:hypothetical protein